MKMATYFLSGLALIQLVLLAISDFALQYIPGFYWSSIYESYVTGWCPVSVAFNAILLCGTAFSMTTESVIVHIENTGDAPAIKVCDVITPKHDWSSYEDEFTDIHQLASSVHKESRK